MRQNKIIEMLKRRPCTADMLPYGIKSRMRHRELIFSIKVSGTRTNASKIGRFTMVYYLIGDAYRAIQLFVDVNADVLDKLDFSSNNALDSGLPKWQAQAIRNAYRGGQNHETN